MDPDRGRGELLSNHRLTRWRAYLALPAVVVIALWWLITGGPGYVIKIDYQWVAGEAHGAEVVIDGVVVGELEYRPQRINERGFKVTKGEHIVELRTENCRAQPETILVETSRLIPIFADIAERGRGCEIFFR
jgi:hypothetical protein